MAEDTKKDFYDLVRKFEVALIIEALKKYGYISRAAESLKLNRTTLTEKMRKHGIRNIKTEEHRVVQNSVLVKPHKGNLE